MDARLTREDRDAPIFPDDDAGGEPGAALAAFARGLRGDETPLSAAGPAPLLIRDVAREFGVSARALRFYEDKGLLRPRRHGTKRLYGDRERRDLALIMKGKKLGFTLAEIGALLAAQDDAAGPGAAGLELAVPPEQIVAQLDFLERQRQELDAAIVALRMAHRHLTEVARARTVA
ncbi:MerR family transcriptional regulator [Methylocella sp.]|uniref:MerR family transcriptional regulator n=1 Tax=Methylocella sp. TaxID=1978226 RepID=UPI003783B79E